MVLMTHITNDLLVLFCMLTIGTFEMDHMLDFPDLNPSGMATPDIVSSGLAVQPDTVLRSASPYLASDNSGNPLNLNIDLLLDERDMDLYERDEELSSVTHVMLRHISKLKKIYSYYSCLGQHTSVDNTFVMSRLQFWRFLKDSKVHHHGFTISELDRTIAARKSSNVHDPHEEVLMREFLNAIIIIGYRLYNREHNGSEKVLSWCLSKLMTENILRNNHYCKVGGSVFADPLRAPEAIKRMSKSWDIFCSLCVPHVCYPHEPIFKYRQFMFMLNDFHLMNSDLSPEEVLKLLKKDNPELAGEDFCNLELEMTFLEFFEAIIDCATVYVTEAVIKGHLSPKATPAPSSRSQSAESLTRATSKPGLDSPDEGRREPLLRKFVTESESPKEINSSLSEFLLVECPDQFNGANSIAETLVDRESPERVCRVMSGASDFKVGTNSPTKGRDTQPTGQSVSGEVVLLFSNHSAVKQEQIIFTLNSIMQTRVSNGYWDNY